MAHSKYYIDVFRCSNFSWALPSEKFYIQSVSWEAPSHLPLPMGVYHFNTFQILGKDWPSLHAQSGRLIGWSQAVVPRAMALELLNRASVSKQTCNANICQHLNTGFTKQRLWKLSHLFQSKQTNDRLGLLGCTSVLSTFPRTAFNKKAAGRWDCFHLNRLLGWNWHF